MYYFTLNKDNLIDVFWFGFEDHSEIEFEYKMISLIIENIIPKSSFNAFKIDKVNFTSRALSLDGNCFKKMKMLHSKKEIIFL